MPIFFRHLVLCVVPVVFVLGAGYGFTRIQGSCTAMVGPLLTAQCHRRQREYQRRFEFAGAITGTLLAATLGTWLEHRRRRAVETANPKGEAS